MPGSRSRHLAPDESVGESTGHERGSSLLLFLILTFALAWAAWLSSQAFTESALLGGLFRIGGPVFLLGVFSPAIAAIVVTARAAGGSGVRALLAPIGRWQVSPWLYVFAVAYMPATLMLSAIVHRWVKGEWPAFAETPWPVMLAGIVLSTWVQAGEELGWRGYALPSLSRRFGSGGGSIVIGVVWAVWHLPLFLLPGTGSTGQSFPLYLLHVTALSVALAWLYWRSGRSLLLVMVMHAAVNNASIVSRAVPGATDPFTFDGSLVAWVTTAIAWMIAVILLYRMRDVDASPRRRAIP